MQIKSEAFQQLAQVRDFKRKKPGNGGACI